MKTVELAWVYASNQIEKAHEQMREQVHEQVFGQVYDEAS
jgi:hypothetical protein